MILRGLASASSGMNALIDMNDTTANNIANVNTVGYKKANLSFQNIYDANINETTASGEVRDLGKLSVGSKVQKLTYDFSQGAMSRTGNPFDIAVEGDGFFKIKSADGDISYTRNGSFTMNNKSFLVTKDGDYVLDDKNKPIQIKLDGLKMHSSNDILVNESGQIEINNENNKSTQQKMGIYDFKNKEDMVCVGGSKFKPTDATTNKEVKAEKFVVQQGTLEMSNANVVNEMINTISTSRNYEALSKMIKAGSETLTAAMRVERIAG